MVEENQEKPKNGSIQMKGGKCIITWRDKQEPFGILFVTKELRNAIKKSRPGFYTSTFRRYARELESGGIFIVPEIKEKLTALKAGKDINRQFIDCIISWLNTLWNFRNVKTGGKDNPNKKYQENYDKIFAKAA